MQTPEHTARLCVHENRRCACQLRREPVLDQLPADDAKIGSFFIGNTKSFLTSAKQLMRRIRDKVPYSQGDRMILGSGGGSMVEGSPARLSRDYNQLIEAYNSGADK